MVIYGIMANVSVGHLFIAGMVPGILLAVMLIAVPLLVCWRNPKLGPPADPVPWRERITSLKYIWHVMLVMVAMFFGVKDSPAVQAMLKAVRPVVVGLLVWTAYDMAGTVFGARQAGWPSLVQEWDKVLIAAAAFALLTLTKINPAFIILGAAALGFGAYR